MTIVISILTVLWLAYLFWEARRVRRARAALLHVVHVNGTRGKSTVSRLIEAGLRAGGLKVFCKTTGTVPMTIDVNGREAPIRRRGRANIKEQIAILEQAARQGAQVLVVECMAVQPELQRAAQHDILQADIGVITNVRRDHTDVMGETLPQICRALSNTIPLCRHLGVEKKTALAGMEAFHRDPYALSVYRLGAALFINGLSINDVQSTCIVWKQLREKHRLQQRELILLLNNRADRGSRTEDMLQVCLTLNPAQVWLMGAAQGYMRRGLARRRPDILVRSLSGPEELDVNQLGQNQVIYAIGNIAHGGRELMVRVEKEGTPLVP